MNVSRSLASRDGFSRERSFVLWLRHTLEAERLTRAFDRKIVELEDFESDPTSALEKLAVWLKVPRKGRSSRVSGAIEEVYDRNLIHYLQDESAEDELLAAYPWVHDAYEALRTVARGEDPNGTSTLDSVWEEIQAADRLLLGNPTLYLSDIQRDVGAQAKSESVRLQKLIEVQRAEIGAQRNEIDELRTAVGSLPDAITTDAARGFTNIGKKLSAIKGAQSKEAKVVKRLLEALDQASASLSKTPVLETGIEKIVESLNEISETGASQQGVLSETATSIRTLSTSQEQSREALVETLGSVGDRVDRGQQETAAFVEKTSSLIDQLAEQIRTMANANAESQDELSKQLQSTSAKSDRQLDTFAELAERIEKKHYKLLKQSLELSRETEKELFAARNRLEVEEARHQQTLADSARLEQDLNAARDEVQELESRLQQFERELDHRTELTAALEQTNRQLRQQLEYLEGSISWRWTAPLRWVRSLVKPTVDFRETGDE